MSTRSYDFGSAVFHFFHIAGKKPVAVLWIALWQALLMGGLAYLAWMAFGDFYIWMIQTAMSGVEPDETEIINRMSSMMSLSPLVTIGGIAVSLMAQAAWLRLLTRQEMAPIIPFRIGGDELHLFVTNLGLIAIGVGFYFASMLVLVIFGVSAAVAFSGGGDAGSGMTAGLIIGAGVLALIGIAVFVAVRVSAAPALSVLEKRIAFPSWGATKGVFWPVLGSYFVLAIVLAVLSSIVGLLINFAFLGALWPTLSEFFTMAQSGQELDPEEVLAVLSESFSSTGTITTLVSVGLLSVLLRSIVDGIWHGVGAYTALSTQPVAAPTETD